MSSIYQWDSYIHTSSIDSGKNVAPRSLLVKRFGAVKHVHRLLFLFQWQNSYIFISSEIIETLNFQLVQVKVSEWCTPSSGNWPTNNVSTITKQMIYSQSCIRNKIFTSTLIPDLNLIKLNFMHDQFKRTDNYKMVNNRIDTFAALICSFKPFEQGAHLLALLIEESDCTEHTDVSTVLFCLSHTCSHAQLLVCLPSLVWVNMLYESVRIFVIVICETVLE